MAFVTVEDMYGSVECVCFPKVYDRIRNFLETDKVVSLKGKISISADKAPAIIVEGMDEFKMDEQSAPAVQPSKDSKAEIRPAEETKLRLWLNVTGLDEADKEELLETLTFYAGETEVVFVDSGKKMSCSQKVNPGKALLAELSTFLDAKCIKLV